MTKTIHDDKLAPLCKVWEQTFLHISLSIHVQTKANKYTKCGSS
jgi:hypothetical protein